MKMRCPHCKKLARTETSHDVSAIVRRGFFACTNVACGHTFVAYAEIHYTLSPPATPDPKVRLPMSSTIQRRLLIEQLDSAPEVVTAAVMHRGPVTVPADEPPSAPAAL